MRKTILIFLLLMLLGSFAIAASFYRFHTPQSTGVSRAVIIPPGTGAREIIALLHREGILPHPLTIAVPMLLKADLHALKAGEYELSSTLSPVAVLDKIARGKIIVHKFGIPEGWNSFQYLRALANEPMVSGNVPPSIAEGSVFPDTILFQRGQPRDTIVAFMQKRMRDIIAYEWAHREPGLFLTTPEEALVLASIVEKETGLASERAVIAGVFYNRLRLGMRLQSDPTVAYGIEAAYGGMPLKRSLTTNDLQFDTPYNTYLHTGLPPTPICNPGLAAIRAVLHPATTDALYFVATGHGGHAFAATLKEHNSNVADYRLTLRSPNP